jgi:hypothetical protein
VRTVPAGRDASTSQLSTGSAGTLITSTLQRWYANTEAVQRVIDGNYLLANMGPVAIAVQNVSKLGMQLVADLEHGRTYSPAQCDSSLRFISGASVQRNEVVVAAAYPVGDLLGAACTYVPEALLPLPLPPSR